MYAIFLSVLFLFASCAGNSNKNISSTNNSNKNTTSTVSENKPNISVKDVRNVVYFDFDKYNISDENYKIIEVKALALIAENQESISIYGHCDQRGSVDYNLALGQKRADAVADIIRKLLKEKKFKDVQIKTISFGKQKVVVQEENESAYAKNRRAEIE